MKMNNIISDGEGSHTAVHTYFRQLEAFKDAFKSSGEPKTVFSFETNLSGSRKFVVTTKERFYEFYSNLKQPRHYYEVIPEKCKSRLYFDLEFPIVHNQSKDGFYMTRKFIRKVNECLFFKYKVS